MMKKLNFIILIILLLVTPSLYSQVGIGINSTTPEANASLDVSSYNKGLLLPRISMTSADLSSTTSPINNPAEGLLIYNYDSTVQLPGYYLRRNNAWELLSENNNKVADFLVYNQGNSVTITPPIGNYLDIDNTSRISTTLVNNIAGANLNTSTGIYSLPKGKYSVTITYNFTNSSETAFANGVQGKDVVLNAYSIRAIDDASGTQQGDDYQANLTSFATLRKHTVVANIKFTLNSPTNVRFQIGRINGGTYTGDLTYNNAFIHIEKSVLK